MRGIKRLVISDARKGTRGKKGICKDQHEERGHKKETGWKKLRWARWPRKKQACGEK